MKTMVRTWKIHHRKRVLFFFMSLILEWTMVLIKEFFTIMFIVNRCYFNLMIHHWLHLPKIRAYFSFFLFFFLIIFCNCIVPQHYYACPFALEYFLNFANKTYEVLYTQHNKNHTVVEVSHSDNSFGSEQSYFSGFSSFTLHPLS